MKYAHTKDGQVIKTFNAKPKGVANVSFGANPSDEDLAAHNVYPVESIEPEFDPATQRRGGWGEPVIDGDTVTRTREVIDLTAEEVEQRRVASIDLEIEQIEASITQRMLRDAILAPNGQGKQMLQEKENAIAALRSKRK